MKFYFQLQYQLFNRHLKEFGIPFFIGYPLILFAFGLISYLLCTKLDLGPYLYLIVGLWPLIKAGEKERNTFLKIQFVKGFYRKIRLLENLFLVSPFVIVLSLFGHYELALIQLISAPILALSNLHIKSLKSLPTPFYHHPFEFAVGFRKTFLLIFLIYGLAVVGIITPNFNLGIAALVLLFLLCLFFYNEPEEVYFQWIFSKTPQQFLMYKIRIALFYALCLSLPISLGLTVYFPDKWMIIVAVEILGLLCMVLIIVSKYSAYPNPISVAQGTIIALGFWFPPLLLLIIPHFYVKATKRLNSLYHDSH